MHIHKWTKWEKVTLEEFDRKRGTWNDLLVQERQCTKCGRTQVEQL